jgi:hypothetical protein
MVDAADVPRDCHFPSMMLPLSPGMLGLIDFSKGRT